MSKIRASLEEIKNRIQRNLQKLCDDRDSTLSSLLDELYDKNKEKIIITRQEHKRSVQEAEVSDFTGLDDNILIFVNSILLLNLNLLITTRLTTKYERYAKELNIARF